MRRDDIRSWVPSYGPDWDRAVEYGIDVTLLLDNLRLTPQQRILQLHGQVQLVELLRAGAKAAAGAGHS